MANFDEDYFDSGAEFDEAGTKPTMKKIIVKQELDSKSDLELKDYSGKHKILSAGSTVFPGLAAGQAAFTAADSGFTSALEAAAEQADILKEKNRLKDAARVTLENVLTARGHIIESTPGVTEDQVNAVGMGVKGTAATPHIMPKVSNLTLSTGDNAGEVDAHWNAVKGTATYAMQWSPDPVTDKSWKDLPVVTKSKATLTGQTSGSKIWLHVCAVSASGYGPWSSPVPITVP